MRFRKTLQASAFSFFVLNVVEKAVFTHSLNYGGLGKERYAKQTTDTVTANADYF